MADRGMKIAKDDKTISATGAGDYKFWTKYPPMTLMETKEVEIDIFTDGYSGTISVSHSYDYIPTVVGLVRKISGTPSYDVDERYLMPVENVVAFNCDGGLTAISKFDYKIYDSRVDINYYTSCSIMGYEEAPLDNITLQVDLLFYMWELGAEWPE